MKKIRIFWIVVALLAFSATLPATQADAAVGPSRLQREAQAQTDLLLRRYVDHATASPSTCNYGRRHRHSHGVFLLPTRFGAGDATFTCHVSTNRVLLDIGGAVATEDNRGDTYTLASGEVLTFTRANLERICDDLVRVYPEAAATVDGKAISGTQVSTAAFTAHVNPKGGQLWTDSVDLGHPGLLAASYCGWKAEIRLTRGRHLIEVTFEDGAVFRYTVIVRRQHRRG